MFVVEVVLVPAGAVRVGAEYVGGEQGGDFAGGEPVVELRGVGQVVVLLGGEDVAAGADGPARMGSAADGDGAAEVRSYDSASSWALRKNPDSATRDYVQIFEWINCNAEGNYRSYVVDQDSVAAADLRTIGWNNTAASVRVTIVP